MHQIPPLPSLVTRPPASIRYASSPACAAIRPSRATAKPRIGVVVSSTAEPTPVATSQRHSVPSDDDENTVWPSRVNSTCVIRPRWPRSMSRDPDRLRRAIRAVIDADPQRRGEPLELAAPVADQAGQRDDHRGAIEPAVLLLEQDVRDGLQRLAQAHVVGEHAAGLGLAARIAQARWPRIAGAKPPAAVVEVEPQHRGADLVAAPAAVIDEQRVGEHPQARCPARWRRRNRHPSTLPRPVIAVQFLPARSILIGWSGRDPERSGRLGSAPWVCVCSVRLWQSSRSWACIAIERETLQIARLGVTVARGAFEPQLSLSLDHARADSPPLSRQAGGAGTIVTTTNQDWNLSLSQRLATGTRLELDFVNSRTRSTAGTAVEPLNYRSNLALSLTQPLLRGFSPDLVVPRIDVLRAEIASERERAQLAVVAADVVQRTETAYWELVQALVGYGVQLRSRQRAEDQLALTHRQIDAGLLPPSDLISSRSPQAASHSPRGALSRGDRMIASPFTLRRITFHQHRLVHAEPVHCLPA